MMSKNRKSEKSITKRAEYRIESDTGGGESTGSNNVFWLRWNTQTSHLASELATLFQEGGDLSLTDVTLACDGQFVQAHRLILSLCSPYFRRLFQVNRADKGNTIVILSNVKFQHVRNILEFIYNGEVEVSNQELEAFLVTGKMLQIQGLGEYYGLNESGQSVDESLEGNEPANEFPIRIRDPRSLRERSQQKRYSGYAQPADDDEGNAYIDDNDNDVCSNYSDELAADMDESSNFEIPEKKPKLPEKPPKPGKKPKARPKHEWSEIDPVPKEELRDNWRRDSQKSRHPGTYVAYYYCGFAKSGQCKAFLKEELVAGKTKFYVNQQPHTNHRETPVGISRQGKEFILKAYEQGVRTPLAIIKLMEAENMTPPRKSKIVTFLSLYRRKNNPGFKPTKERKSEDNNESSADAGEGAIKRKRGRPRKGESDFDIPPSGQVIEQSSTASASIAVPSTSTSSALAHHQHQQSVAPTQQHLPSLPLHPHPHMPHIAHASSSVFGQPHQSHLHGHTSHAFLGHVQPGGHDPLSFLHFN